MLLVAHVRERPWTVGLKVNAVETEYDATVHGILGNLRGGFGDMIAFRHVMRGHTLSTYRDDEHRGLDVSVVPMTLP